MFYKLFYFFDFIFQPLKFSLSINLFGDVRDLVTDHIFDSILINAVLLSHRYEVFTTIMWSMLRVQIQFISNHAETLLVCRRQERRC